MAYASKEWTEKYLGTTLKAARAEGLLVNGTDFVPVGTIIPFMGVKAPKDYLICDGTEYQISSYSDLASFIERQFGAVNHFGGNGTTTFAVPDLRGEFLRGSGANSHTNQGSGSSVGIHQDATEHINYGVNTTDKSIWFDTSTPRSGTTQISIGKTDSDLKLTTGDNTKGLYASLTPWSTSSNYSHYTARPTNTSVLYCIKATNASEINVTNNYLGIDRYTEDEICIGEYAGKPLYRRLFKVTTPSTVGSSTVLFTYSSDMEIQDIDGCILGSDEDIPVNFYYATNNYISCWSNNKRKELKMVVGTSSYVNKPAAIIISYTKTTDAVGSFTPSMIDNNISIGGVAYTDYSEEEKVIGKWKDGRPIYRKIVVLDQEVQPTKNWTSRFSIPDSKELINVVVKTPDNTIRTSGGLFKIEDEYFKDWQLSEFCAYQTAIVEYTKSTDAPNSFKPSMVLGGVSIEEASDEDAKEVW